MRCAPTVFLLGACFQSIAPDVPDANDVAPTTGKFATTQNADGSFTTIVDSSSQTEATLGDFDTRAAVMASEPWDLAFQRVEITPAPGVEVARVEAAFVDVVVPPQTGWSGNVVDDWYDYNAETHVLTPRPVTYAVHTSTLTFAFEIERYYDEAGNAGFFTLHWRSL